ncbi:MAG: serine hydroxymethyltransferase [Selenomonadaceae bacterium]|nr:serine hydroxymethyltransferase [Selenomonadaceae bacterium]
MIGKKLFDRLKKFDPELCKLLKLSLDRQMSSLSLISTDSAASPLSQYLKGSVLGNDYIGHNSIEHYSRVEQLTIKRTCEIFKSEHAIVRLGNIIAASRVVLQALANPGDKILSFNLRKKEYCTGSQMQYDFVKFALDPETFKLNFDKLRYLAVRHRPKLIICSPVHYPHNIDYKKLRAIADEVQANVWVDLGQNAGLIVAGKMDSPVPYADVVTFEASNSLHGPQSGIILSREKFAAPLEQKIIDTGHVSLKKNVLAALAITLREITCDEYLDYVDQVITNARALEDGLKQSGIETFCSPTENHLVLARLDQDGKIVSEKLEQAGLLVSPEILMTSNDQISYPILRLSSLDPTTRSLNAEDMFTVGMTLGEFLKSRQDSNAIESVRMIIQEMVENLPLFSDEWLPEAEIVQERDPELMMKAMIYGM